MYIWLIILHIDTNASKPYQVGSHTPAATDCQWWCYPLLFDVCPWLRPKFTISWAIFWYHLRQFCDVDYSLLVGAIYYTPLNLGYAPLDEMD